MSADIRRLHPELKHSSFERGKPRHEPPLRFKPPDILAEDGEELNVRSITIELDSKTTSKIVPHTFISVEDFLSFQKQHDYIMSQQDAKAKWKNICILRDATIAKRDAISANTIDPAEKKARKKHNDQVGLLLKRKDVIMTKAFTIYQQMCGPTLRAEWDSLVQEHCFTTGWKLTDGSTSTLERGQNWDTLRDCKRLHLLTVCDIDAAERHINYVNVNVRKPKEVSIKVFHKRSKEMDELVPSLPCLKDQPNCPAGVARANVSMTDFEMCNLLMRNVTAKMEDEYNCLHDTVPTDPKLLVEQLTKIERKLETISSENKSLDRRKGGPPDDAQRRSRGGKKRSQIANGNGRGEPDKPIPRKKAVAPANDHHCKLCTEYGGVAKTHTTSQCKKWVAGGKSHSEWRGGKTANINMHQGSDVNQLMAQQVEFQNKIMKQMSKLSEKKKKKSKRRRRTSDSDSSDSD